MSTQPGGPGWWQAAGGYWYPPESWPGYGAQPGYGPPPGYGAQPGYPPASPGYGPPQAGYGAPPGYDPARSGYGPPPPGQPPPGKPPRRGSPLKVVAIVLGVIVVLLVLAGFAVTRFVSGLVGGSGLSAGGAGCDLVSAADVNAVLGGEYELVQLGGMADLAGPVLDSRVLAQPTATCWGTGPQGRLVRIATYSGGDAASRFVAERQNAMGRSEDRGGGLSVSSPGYFGRDVQAGDQAFCTTADMLGFAGALVHRGGELVYVSTTAAGEGADAVPDVGAGQGGSISFATDEANCALAVRLAEKVR